MGLILESLSPAYGGYTIARDDKVVLIKGAIPGEKVEVEIEEQRRDYSVASVISVVEPSPFRVAPPCPVFGLCGGCQLQFIEYEKQLSIKSDILTDSLRRLGGIDMPLGPSLSDDQWRYRHRAQFKVSKAGEIGFYKASSRDVVPFDSCLLMRDEINEVLPAAKKCLSEHIYREVHVVLGGGVSALLKGGTADRKTGDALLEAGFSGVAFDDGTVLGRPYAALSLGEIEYSVSPWTFFQAHWKLNGLVVSFLIENLAPLDGKLALDLYAGAGNFALPLSGCAKAVTAVEENARAVSDAERNVEINGIKNCSIIRSSAENYRLTRQFDVIVLDPPRPGLTSAVVKKILDRPASMIAYISCNPATLARDLKKLGEKYDIRSVHLVDFFPNTFHIETIALLSLR